MSDPNDKLAALDWALIQAGADTSNDPQVRLIYLPALREMRAHAAKEAGRA